MLVPALFLLYVADLDKCLVSDTRLSSFADDTTVYTLALSNDLREKVATLQQTLDNLHDWGRQSCIRFEGSTQPKQRLGFLHCAARVLDHQGLVAAYKGFIRPVLEYALLA